MFFCCHGVVFYLKVVIVNGLRFFWSKVSERIDGANYQWLLINARHKIWCDWTTCVSFHSSYRQFGKMTSDRKVRAPIWYPEINPEDSRKWFSLHKQWASSHIQSSASYFASSWLLCSFIFKQSYFSSIPRLSLLTQPDGRRGRSPVSSERNVPLPCSYKLIAIFETVIPHFNLHLIEISILSNCETYPW